jgi:hypothetical protein
MVNASPMVARADSLSVKSQAKNMRVTNWACTTKKKAQLL